MTHRHTTLFILYELARPFKALAALFNHALKN